MLLSRLLRHLPMLLSRLLRHGRVVGTRAAIGEPTLKGTESEQAEMQPSSRPGSTLSIRAWTSRSGIARTNGADTSSRTVALLSGAGSEEDVLARVRQTALEGVADDATTVDIDRSKDAVPSE